MELSKFNIQIRNVKVGFLGIALVFLLDSCATKLPFMISAVVPAAEGSVHVKRDRNANYNIDLRIIRLANSKRLGPSKNIYLVWMNTEENGTVNIGKLKTSSGPFSSALKSSLETVTSFKPTGFFITAEDDANISSPAGQMVLKTAF